jgi:ubiquinone/menaquinone biosynthesis C-methylase UbiE
MLILLRRRLDEHSVTNAHAIVGDAVNLPLPDSSVDCAFLVAVLGEIPDRPQAIAELRRVLKSGGALSFMETLTDPDYVFEAHLRDLCQASGFEFLDRSGQLLGYTMSFTAPQRLGSPLPGRRRVQQKRTGENPPLRRQTSKGARSPGPAGP